MTQFKIRVPTHNPSKERQMIEQAPVALGGSEWALIIVSSVLIFFFTGKKIYLHFKK